MEPKTTTPSFHMLLDHCYAFGFYAVAFQSEEEVF